MITDSPRITRTDSDSWSAIFRPSPNESLQEKQDRIARQQEAARISKEIDDAIEKSRKQLEKRKSAVKVLLLGQAESGKSTMLRNFQLAFCPTYFRREIPIWKVIIQLNLIGSVKRLLAIIEDELDTSSSRSNNRSDQPIAGPSSRPATASRASASPHVSTSSLSKHVSFDLKHHSTDPPLTQAHSALRLRLLPLLSVEINLARQLLPEFGGESPPLPSSTGWTKWASGTGDYSSHTLLSGHGEICVRAGGAWKSVLERVTGTLRNPSDNSEDDPPDHFLSQPIQPRSPSSGKFNTRSMRHHPSDPTPLLEALASDIHALWTDPAVKALLKRRGVQMEHSAGFFLNDVTRIGQPGWRPGIDDIVRARLRTFGVEEYRFSAENGSDWYIYDVGGSRGSRSQWVPYFDDVQAIIFLAPLVFNQMLDEDKMINRLEDSISLWREVCGSSLLAHANIILFLNKMDILESTLKAGVQVKTFVPTYGSNPNNMEHVVRYFRDKFRAYHKRLSPKQRSFFCHGTSAIDTQATQVVLSGVREGILRGHLEKLSVI
ncbi:guanine nucleotide binding protein, alpha subunit [Boletus reticuloceps]|uniref:Guanine nucleotide binding protein, alpha subunit n=1 Tax=Boletus reticuloceps TaxID=495285 RepID=A0A8I2YHX6_9AGAM|nr:guanine nucleotide binding protein, alpha subunit [Boletus reticuloceps]